MILCGIKVILTNAHIFLTYMFIRTFPFLVSDQLNNSCFWYECDPARKMKILRRHLMLMLLLPVKKLTMTNLLRCGVKWSPSLVLVGNHLYHQTHQPTP